MKLGLNNIIGNNPALQGDSYSGVINEFGANAVAGYSLQKLDSSYTKDAIGIMRLSDFATTNIGFKEDGSLDTTSISSFCSGTTGVVMVFYDQIGETDLAARSLSAAPTIFTGGSVVTENGKPAIQFDGVDDALANSGATTLDNQSQSFMVSVFNPTSFPEYCYAFGVRQGGGFRGIFLGVSSTPSLRYHNHGTSYNILDSPTISSAQYITSGNYDGSTMRFDYNNSNVTKSSTITADATDTIFMGNHPASFFSPFTGTIQEGIIYSTSKSASDIIGIRDHRNTYYNAF